MKKFLAMILALVMALSLVACGDKKDDPKTDDNQGDNPEVTEITNADEIADEMTSEDGKYEIAFVTDVGQLKDKSFNQGTFDGVKLYAANNGLSYKYYQPANGDQATDDDRYDAMKAAAEGGAKVIVAAGFMQATALTKAAAEFTDVKFVFVDRDSAVTLEDGTALKNVLGICFQEEQCGYLAGYAVVKEGFTKLGFTGGGGGTNPACCRYGYGFVQGADAAAAELGQNIEINYFYGGQFYGDANITSRMEGWYSNGTQVVFACGGGIYTSAVEAALKNNGYVIGVDVDQNYIGAKGVADGTYAYNPFITSAMKGLTEAVNTALADIDAGSWGDIAGSNGNFGLEDGDYIGLPTDADSWNFESFTTDEYEEVKGKIKSGEITVDNSSDDATKPTVSEFTTVNYIQ